MTELDTVLLKTIGPELHRFAERLLKQHVRGDATASDLVQSAIRSHLRAVRKGGSQPVNSLQAMLLTILKRKAWKRLRRRGKQFDEQAVAPPPLDGEPDGAIERLTASCPSPEMQSRLRDLLRALPTDSHRTIAVLSADGHTQEEIATVLSISSRTVRSRIGEIKKYWGPYDHD